MIVRRQLYMLNSEYDQNIQKRRSKLRRDKVSNCKSIYHSPVHSIRTFSHIYMWMFIIPIIKTLGDLPEASARESVTFVYQGTLSCTNTRQQKLNLCEQLYIGLMGKFWELMSSCIYDSYAAAQRFAAISRFLHC